MRDVAAILLAAGRSQRMGAFKPLLPFGDTTIIRSSVRNLLDAGIRDIVAVLGYRAGEVESSLSDLSLEFAHNPDPDSEMGASIACGVSHLPRESKAVLIALGDQPAVPPSIIRAVVDEWRSGERLIIPEVKGRGGHPVLVDLNWRAELLNLDPNQGLRAFFHAHRTLVRRLPVESTYIARDLDTWDDYCALHQEIFGSPPDPHP